MPGLLRGMARTAVVAGTATAVSNRVSRRQGQRWAAQEAPPYPSQGYAAPPPPSAPQPPAGGEDRIEKLKELAALKDQGVLTDEEFAAEKSRILAS
jgi:Short C-terminal domain